MLKKIPFYSNTPDDTHCFQASLRMILKYFLPEREFTWKQLEKMTAKKPDLWTWQLAGILWMQENGFDVRNREVFDYHRFIHEGDEYLLREFGKEVGSAQIKNSDIKQERSLSKKFVQSVAIEKEVPAIADMQRLFQEGFLMIININSSVLNKKPGYTGHSVVITGFSESTITFHDPGLPPMPNRSVPTALFETAWGYQNENAKTLVAFRPKKKYTMKRS